jgi:hypothetical protein
MKKYIIILLFALVSCKSSINSKFEYNETTWVDYFKECVFIKCLEESYKNDSIVEQISKKDILFANDIIYNELDFIKSISVNFVSKIPYPKIPCPECKKTDKFYLANCLRFYKSKELDSIAKIRYKLFLKNIKNP